MSNNKSMQGGSTAIDRQGSQAVIVITQNLESGGMDFSHYGYGDAAEFAKEILDDMFAKVREFEESGSS